MEHYILKGLLYYEKGNGYSEADGYRYSGDWIVVDGNDQGRHCTGIYVILLDSDDLWQRTMYSTVMAGIKKL